MKILTVGASPYLNTVDGRIHRQLLSALGSFCDEVKAAAWDYDTSYFLADPSTGSYLYEEDYEEICVVHPLEQSESKRVKRIGDLVKSFEPDVVVSIGEYYETAIVAQCRHLFKWVNVLLSRSIVPLDDYPGLYQADETILVDECKYGPDHSLFYQNGDGPDRFTVICSARNNRTSNVAAYIAAVRRAREIAPFWLDADFKLHCNLHDEGYADVRRLLKREDPDGVIDAEEWLYASLNESKTDEEMREFYSSGTVLVEPSGCSATYLTVLESMACGCVPLCPRSAVTDELEKNWSGDFDIKIDGILALNERTQWEKVVNVESVAQKIVDSYEFWQSEKGAFTVLQKKCVETASHFSDRNLIPHIVESVDRAASRIFPLMPLALFGDKGKKEYR